jgi:hypothetical protein
VNNHIEPHSLPHTVAVQQDVQMSDVIASKDPALNGSKITISAATRLLWNDPSRFVRYWNYKGAILSGILRAPIFFATYLIGKETLRLALAAATVQFLFRFAFAGVGGALIQAYRHVEPPWKALVAILVLVPTISHAIEFVLQLAFGYLTDTQNLTDQAMLRSICVSIISALFTLFAMRRGIMIVGESESKSLVSDIYLLPTVIFYFVAFIPNEISGMLRRGAFLAAALAFAAFGLFSQLLVWAITNRAYWTYGGGKDLGLLKFWGVCGMLLLFFSIVLSSIVHIKRRKQEK